MWLKLAALGMVAIAVGMIILPHGLGLEKLLDATRSGTETYDVRAFYGVYGIAAGLVVTALGFVAQAVTRRADARP